MRCLMRRAIPPGPNVRKHEFEWSRDRREKTMYDTWQARQDEKPQAGAHTRPLFSSS